MKEPCMHVHIQYVVHTEVVANLTRKLFLYVFFSQHISAYNIFKIVAEKLLSQPAPNR
jgi:hypothetical protein